MQKRILLTGVLLLIIIFGSLLFFTRESTAPAVATFASQEECESATGKTCAEAACDFIPEGKTFEEVCGRGFKKGWQAMNEPELQ